MLTWTYSSIACLRAGTLRRLPRSNVGRTPPPKSEAPPTEGLSRHGLGGWWAVLSVGKLRPVFRIERGAVLVLANLTIEYEGSPREPVYEERAPSFFPINGEFRRKKQGNGLEGPGLGQTPRRFESDWAHPPSVSGPFSATLSGPRTTRFRTYARPRGPACVRLVLFEASFARRQGQRLGRPLPNR